MNARLASYATRAVPRYTSYPTVPHFSAGIGAPDQVEWLGELDPEEPVSLYLHVPFCRELCWYCGCNMKLARRTEPVARYAKMLRREIELVAAHMPARMTVSHLHWGGGTPTALAPEDLDRAMELVRTRFDIAPGAELAIESDPRTLSAEMATLIGQLGFTRASFGVQEFDPLVQAAINRIQPPEMVRDAVSALRNAGVTGINFDLIYGLPHQSIETLARTIDTCAGMRPDRVVLFGYAHVPWMARKQRLIDENALPGAGARLEQARRASELIVSAGYVPVGLDHFALPEDPLAHAAANGALRRNFQGYTTDTARTLLGLGASSIGRTPSGYVQSITEPGAWARSIEAGELPVAKGYHLTRDDIARGAVIEALMCNGRVNLDAAGHAAGLDPDWWLELTDELDELAADGLIHRVNGEVSLVPGAETLVRVVAACFDRHLRRGSARHSAAV